MNTLYIIISLTLYFTILTISVRHSLEEDKIFIRIGEEIYLVNLIESSITEELISLLPLKATPLEDNNKLTKKLKLSVKIETESFYESRNNSYISNIGDIFLYKGNELVLFNENKIINNNDGEYIKIGFIKKSNELFNSINKIKKKTILLWNTLNYADYKGKIKPYGYNNIMNYFTWKIFTFFCFLLL